jgi:hypothetical protein
MQRTGSRFLPAAGQDRGHGHRARRAGGPRVVPPAEGTAEPVYRLVCPDDERAPPRWTPPRPDQPAPEHITGRIVTVASQAERLGRLDFDDLDWGR